MLLRDNSGFWSRGSDTCCAGRWRAVMVMKQHWQLVILNLFQLGSKKRLSIFPKETWLPCSISQDQVREKKCKTMQKVQKLDDVRNILSWGCCIPTLLLVLLKSLLGCSDTAEAKEPQKDLCHCYCLWCLSYLLPGEPKAFSLALSYVVVHPLCLWELGQVRHELAAVISEAGGNPRSSQG